MTPRSSRLWREKSPVKMQDRALLFCCLLLSISACCAGPGEEADAAEAEELRCATILASASAASDCRGGEDGHHRSPRAPVSAGFGKCHERRGRTRFHARRRAPMQTSSLYSRVAAGVTVSQLITDFGRTANLVASAKARAAAQEQNRGKCTRLDSHRGRSGILSGAGRRIGAEGRAGGGRESAAHVAPGAGAGAELAQIDAGCELRRGRGFGSRAGSGARGKRRPGSRGASSAALGTAQSETFDLADEPLPAPLDPDPGRRCGSRL